MTVYNSNFRLIGAGDSVPARLLPFALLNRGTVFFDAYGPSPPANYWFRQARNGHLASLYPIILPLLITPLYVPAAIYVALAQPPSWRFETLSEIMEKFSASFIAALSAIFLFLLLRRLTSQPNAILLTLAYAFGTETWSISSQALWQHGLAEAFLAVALLLLTHRQTTGSALAIGALGGLMAFNRPPDALFALAIATAFLLDHRPQLPAFLIGAAVAGLPFLIYNFVTFGNPAGAYGILAGRRLLQHTDPIPIGAAALLVSPGKGLFIYSPFLLFAFGAAIPPRRDTGGVPYLFLWIAFAAQVFLYALADWTGGACYGPRFLTDAVPFLVVALVPALDRIPSGFGRFGFVLCVLFAVAVQAIGAFCFPKAGSQALSHAEFWKPTGAQFYREAKAGLARPVFLEKVIRRLAGDGHAISDSTR